jgi:hypothetical protein
LAALSAQVLGCLTLFMTANLLKVLFAKMMASKFNQHSHYEKMHQSLKRVGGGRSWGELAGSPPAATAAAWPWMDAAAGRSGGPARRPACLLTAPLPPAPARPAGVLAAPDAAAAPAL